MTDKEKIKALTRNLELACRYINQSIEHHGDNLITVDYDSEINISPITVIGTIHDKEQK